MVSSEVQRTLVKSPPELWAELGDPAALARHLGELGEIRIVRTEPESTIEWEAEDLTGTVSIKPSGWGTKVTLTVTRDEPQALPESDTGPEASPTAVLPVTTEPEASPEPAASQPEPSEPTDLAAPEEPKRSFFARLFGRRRRHRLTVQEPAAHETLEPSLDNEPAPAAQAAPPRASKEQSDREPLPSDAFAAVSEVLAPQTLLSSSPFAGTPHASVTAAEPNATADDHTNYEGPPASGLSAELKAAEEIAADDVIAVLTAVLDRLGAAHHRPFSRA
jgi:hypothetical protein